MKLMKFGGTSVGSPESLQRVKKIIENQKEPVIVVVSALDGVTDRLLLAADFALNGNAGYKGILDEIISRHKVIIEKMVPNPDIKRELEPRAVSYTHLDVYKRQVHEVVVFRRVGSEVVQLVITIPANIKVKQLPVALNQRLTAALLVKLEIEVVVHLLTLVTQ